MEKEDRRQKVPSTLYTAGVDQYLANEGTEKHKVELVKNSSRDAPSFCSLIKFCKGQVVEIEGQYEEGKEGPSLCRAACIFNRNDYYFNKSVRGTFLGSWGKGRERIGAGNEVFGTLATSGIIFSVSATPETQIHPEGQAMTVHGIPGARMGSRDEISMEEVTSTLQSDSECWWGSKRGSRERPMETSGELNGIRGLREEHSYRRDSA